MDMEKILEALEQVDKDLKNSVKEKEGKWELDASGKIIKKSRVEADTKEIDSAKGLLDAIIKAYDNGNLIKSQDEFQALSKELQEIQKTLKAMSDNKKLDNTIKTTNVDPVKDIIKKALGELNRKGKAIEQFLKVNDSDEKIVNTAIKTKEKEKNEISKYNDRLKTNQELATDVYNIFKEDFDTYDKLVEQESEISKLEKLYSELEKLQNDLSGAADDKKAEIKDKIEKKAEEIAGKSEEYKSKYDSSANIATSKEDIKKDGKTKLGTLKTKVSNEKTTLNGNFVSNSINTLQYEDKDNFEKFCYAFKCQTTDFADLKSAKKVLMDKISSVELKIEENEAKIESIDDTINGFKEYDVRAKEYEDTINMSQEDMNSKFEGQVENDIKLMKLDEMDRKQLRTVLKESVYKNERFAGIKSWFVSRFKGLAVDKIEGIARTNLQIDYKNDEISRKEHQMNQAKSARDEFVKQYLSAGVELNYSSKTPVTNKEVVKKAEENARGGR